ncbi:MAG: hypothetical protein CL610_25190 [Anaerolineaceae bacterium]|nr:hypothetical protein [Anaerolineaceae bacterium]
MNLQTSKIFRNLLISKKLYVARDVIGLLNFVKICFKCGRGAGDVHRIIILEGAAGVGKAPVRQHHGLQVAAIVTETKRARPRAAIWLLKVSS